MFFIHEWTNEKKIVRARILDIHPFVWGLFKSRYIFFHRSPLELLVVAHAKIQPEPMIIIVLSPSGFRIDWSTQSTCCIKLGVPFIPIIKT